MAYQDAALIQAANGVAPQFGNAATQTFRVWEGDANGPKVQDPLSLAKLDGILTKLADPATQGTLAALKALFDNGTAKVTLNGSNFEEDYNGLTVVRTRTMGYAHESWDFNNNEYITLTAGSYLIESTYRSVNGYSNLSVIARNTPFNAQTHFGIRVIWAGSANAPTEKAADEDIWAGNGVSPKISFAGVITTKSQYVKGMLFNHEATSITLHVHFMLRA